MVILGKRLSCRHRSREENEGKAAEREKRNGVSLANYISLLKNTVNGNKYIVKRHTVSSFFSVLTSSRVIGGIMYTTAVIIGKMIRPVGTHFPDSDCRSIIYLLRSLQNEK